MIPLVHFVAFPASPFIGGYIGINSASAHGGSPASKSLVFGALLGFVIFFVLALTAGILTLVVDLGRFLWLMWGGVFVLTLYTASMSGLGAMFSQLKGPQGSQDIGQPRIPEPGFPKKGTQGGKFPDSRMSGGAGPFHCPPLYPCRTHRHPPHRYPAESHRHSRRSGNPEP